MTLSLYLCVCDLVVSLFLSLKLLSFVRDVDFAFLKGGGVVRDIIDGSSGRRRRSEDRGLALRTFHRQC